MANQGLSQILPYKFRNTGSKSESVMNILQAPPLELSHMNIPLPTTLTAILANASGEPEVIKTDFRKRHDYPAIVQLLENASEDMMLWKVGIWAGHIEFNFRNKKLRVLKSDPKTTTSKIIIDAKLGSQFWISAPAFGAEPERQLFCEYGEDVIWGNSIRIVEYEAGRGVHSATFYPKAKEDYFEEIINS